MKQLLFALLFIPALLFAQEDQHYLAGAVPVADGKVVFTREINAPSLSKAQIYQQLLKWGQENFNTKESRVAYQNEAKRRDRHYRGRIYSILQHSLIPRSGDDEIPYYH